jgi:hypothetical protein
MKSSYFAIGSSRPKKRKNPKKRRKKKKPKFRKK